MTSLKPRVMLCADELRVSGGIGKYGRPVTPDGKILVFRGEHAVHLIVPILGTPVVNVAYIGASSLISSAVDLFAPEFEYQNLH